MIIYLALTTHFLVYYYYNTTENKVLCHNICSDLYSRQSPPKVVLYVVIVVVTYLTSIIWTICISLTSLVATKANNKITRAGAHSHIHALVKFLDKVCIRKVNIFGFNNSLSRLLLLKH